MQDYFAHCIKISLCVRSGKYYNSNYNKTTYSDRYLTGINNDLKSKYNVPLSAFEDNVNFMPWRVSLAKKITTIFYSRWAINKKINTIKLYIFSFLNSFFGLLFALINIIIVII